jgi:hypothetical protein
MFANMSEKSALEATHRELLQIKEPISEPQTLAVENHHFQTYLVSGFLTTPYRNCV